MAQTLQSKSEWLSQCQTLSLTPSIRRNLHTAFKYHCHYLCCPDLWRATVQFQVKVIATIHNSVVWLYIYAVFFQTCFQSSSLTSRLFGFSFVRWFCQTLIIMRPIPSREGLQATLRVCILAPQSTEGGDHRWMRCTWFNSAESSFY